MKGNIYIKIEQWKRSGKTFEVEKCDGENENRHVIIPTI